MAKRIGSNADDLEPILAIGSLVAGYFLVVKPLVGLFGSDDASKNTVKDQSELPPAENPFSLQFQPSVDLFNANPSYDENGDKLSMDQYYQVLKSYYDQNEVTPLGNPYIDNVIKAAETLHSNLSLWHMSTNVNAIMGAFSALEDQRQVSEMAAYYKANFNEDLFSALQIGIFKRGLTPDQFAVLINQINALPVNSQ